MDSNVEHFLNKFQSHLNIKIILYGLCLFFYITSFHYIFLNSSAQYMAWLLTFVVNAAYPFLWLGDYMNLVKYRLIPWEEIGSYFYISICLFSTLLLEIILLIFVNGLAYFFNIQ